MNSIEYRIQNTLTMKRIRILLGIVVYADSKFGGGALGGFEPGSSGSALAL